MAFLVTLILTKSKGTVSGKDKIDTNVIFPEALPAMADTRLKMEARVKDEKMMINRKSPMFSILFPRKRITIKKVNSAVTTDKTPL
jgi:hypothetical protein